MTPGRSFLSLVTREKMGQSFWKLHHRSTPSASDSSLSVRPGVELQSPGVHGPGGPLMSCPACDPPGSIRCFPELQVASLFSERVHSEVACWIDGASICKLLAELGVSSQTRPGLILLLICKGGKTSCNLRGGCGLFAWGYFSCWKYL